MALPKRYRLTHTKDFSKVYQHGKHSSTRHLAVKVLEKSADSPAQESARFGITVSQKVSKRAVVRNRLKRQIRAALLTLIPSLKSGVWVVIVVRSPALQCDYWQFLQELKQLFSELEVFDGH